MMRPRVEQSLGIHVDLEMERLEIVLPLPGYGHFLCTEKYERDCFNNLNSNTEFTDVVDENII